MRISFSIELFGYGYEKSDSRNRFKGWNKKQSYIARIIDFDSEFIYKRVFVHGYLDFSKANGAGSRGIFKTYFLDDGLYEVSQRTTWKSIDRYFILVSNGQYHKIMTEEANQWLIKKTSVSQF
jgi:hypothetical protein